MTARSFRRAGQRDRPATTILRGLREQSVRGATCNGPRAVNLAGTRGKRSCLNVASPGRIKAELRVHLMSKLNQLRIASMTGIRQRVHYFRSDMRWAFAQQNHAAGQE